ncbi:hypothetical protein HYDPIDRAFT_111874 [Hydnomerulius pinastri MD-312]|uniref:Cytochrome P450 n=1 Tax=Hydnomerulius pinastri MD-312 TaxID=994086 RepID=A0A0C9VG26_9AGAM|nr:hypothetical protein HYDPIDRAFT_111874 [Hydnomerulius pinastri MD-312]
MSSSAITALVGVLAGLLVIEGTRKLRQKLNSNRPPLPPSPTAVPFLGHVLGVNRDAPYITYAEWAKTYGDIMYTHLLGQEMIVLNSEELAIELLEKRSHKYSDRPAFSTTEMFGWEWGATLTPYGPRFRLHRRIYHQVFHANAALSYRPQQLQKAYEMLGHILTDPAEYAEHFDTFSASVVMAVTYGYDLAPGDTFVNKIKRAADIFLSVATPEAAAVCTAFPFLKKLPPWFPFMGFKYEAAESARLASEGLHQPYEWTRRKFDEGTAAPSMVSDALTRYQIDEDSKDPVLVQGIKEAAATVYAAAVETTNSTLLVFLYLMQRHPEVQVRAQAEIDKVVGTQRLPTFDDKPALPYVEAVLRETMRWHPVTPVGVPHATSEDDVYEGYYIPKGATVMANSWAIAHNEEKYPDSFSFIPERFLNSDGTLTDDTVSWVFGFGRRMCPGRHVATASVWVAMVCILALFKIEKTEGSDNVKWTKGLSSHPLPFPCKFIPRDADIDAQQLASLISASQHES